jgi:hypothetical protein
MSLKQLMENNELSALSDLVAGLSLCWEEKC